MLHSIVSAVESLIARKEKKTNLYGAFGRGYSLIWGVKRTKKKHFPIKLKRQICARGQHKYECTCYLLLTSEKGGNALRTGACGLSREPQHFLWKIPSNRSKDSGAAK